MENTTPAPAEPTEMANAMIAVESVERHFGSIRAVDGVDLEIRRGELFGLIGHNGAGKSTLFKMMLGLLPVSAGHIRIDGEDIHAGNFREVRRRIGYLPENVVLYDNLTGLETLRFIAKLKNCGREECIEALETVGLSHAANRRVREYSKGMRQRLGFAQSLLGKPQLLFLDEPTNGLDPEAIRAFYATLRGLRDSGVTVVLTSHILSEIQERVDRLAIMAAGKIQALGTVQSLRERVDLPLRVEVRTEAALGGALTAILGSFGITPRPVEAATDRLIFDCPRQLKMKLFGAVAGLGEGVADVSIFEPSLEDVFFGFAD